MKKGFSRMWSKFMAMLLVFCLTIGLLPMAAFAEENESTDEKILNYVSLGDSMSNGYGLSNYDNNGHNNYGEEAYPNQFASWLVTEGYADKVNLSQLAVSAMRAEDLHFILEYGQEGAYAGDQYTINNFTEGRFNGNGFEGTQSAATEFQNAVRNADIISVGTGNANFGVFLMYSVMDAIGALGDTEDGYAWVKFEDALAMCDAETKAFALQAYEIIKTELLADVPVEATDMATKVADRMAYVVTSYVLNYGGVLEAIVELNPDAEVMIVGLMNSMNGLVIDCTVDGQDFELPVGEVMGNMVGAMNAYLAGLPATLQAGGQYPEATFYFAASPNVEMIVNVLDKDMMQDDNSVVRERTISEIEKIVWPLLNKMTHNNDIDEDDDPYGDISKDDVTTYEAAIENNYAKFGEWLIVNSEKALSVVTYVAFENAAIEAAGKEGNLNGAALLKLMDMDALGARFEIIYDQFEAKLQDSNFGKNAEYYELSNGIMQMYTMLALPDAMVAALMEDEEIASLLNLFARMMVGDGIGCHPSKNGHDSLFAAVKESYASKHTVQDETIENVEIALNELYNLLETYGPEVAAQVWAQWEEYGYVDAVEKSMAELEEMIKARYEYYTETALPAIEEAVNELSAQKDELTAELIDLKAQLEVKKAELAKVIAEQEIGSVNIPNISIDVTIGDNQQTIVPDNDCNVEGGDIQAELEAAVKDLEHAITVIEALINDVEADIADMVELAKEIAKAIGELEKTLNEVAEAAEDLKVAFDAVVEVLTDDSSKEIVDTVITSFEAARDTALAAAKVLELTMSTADEMMSDVDTMIEKLIADGEALYNKFMTDLPGCIEQIPEEVQMLIGASVVGIQEVAKLAQAEIETKLAEDIAALEAEYADDIANAKAELVELEAKIKAEIETKYAEIAAGIEAEYNAQIAELEAKKAALEAELNGYKAELEALAEDAAAEVREGLQAQIDRVTNDLAVVSDDLECALGHLDSALQQAYEQVVAEVEQAYAELKAELEEVLADLKAELEQAIEDLKAAADKSIQDLIDEVNKKLDELGEIGEKLSDAFDSILESIHEEMAKAQKVFEDLLSGSIDSIEDLKDALIDMGADALADLVDELVETINDLLEAATTADLTIDDDFKYVAIGDGSAAPESYVEKLTAALNAEAAENGVDEIEVVNNAYVGNTVAAERANLSDVSDADLITIGFSNVEFLDRAVANAMSEDAVELDWAAVVGEQNVQYVEQLLAEVAAKIAEAGIEGENAILVNTAIEAYAYAAMQYATEIPELVNDIHAVNADALVIIVGMYNPMEGVTIALDGNTTLEIGEYIDYLVKGVGVHGVAYSILSGNSIYVDAPEVDTINADAELSIIELAKMAFNNFQALYPNAVGDDYIAAEIADALNITYVKTEETVLLGDVNDDGVVDNKDLVRMRKYLADPDKTEINFANSDVNLDGEVDNKDLVRMRKHFADGVAFG